MSLSDANIIQENSGTSLAATNHVVSVGSGTTAGNTVLIFTYSLGALTAPAGVTVDDGGGTSSIGAFRVSDVAASVTSWTFTTVASQDVAWVVKEVSNIDLTEPFEVTATGSGSPANGGTLSTGTTTQNAGLSVIAVALFATSAGTTAWSGYTNGFEETSDVAGGNSSLAAAQYFQNGTTGTFSSTATRDSGGTNSAVSRVAVYRAADTSIVAPLAGIAGFEWGTHGGIANTGSTSLLGYAIGPVGTWGTHYLIQGSSARNGSYGFRLTTSAASAYALVGIASSIKAASVGFNVRVVSATGTVVVAAINNATTARAQVLYDSSTNKFGVRCGTTGTTQWQSGTTATNTWVWIDLRWKSYSTTWNADWRIETATDTYTDQTSATLSGQSATATADNFTLGNAGATQTMTADFDDVVTSIYYVAYPLGVHQVRLLVPETTGASVSGTSSNFNEFTNNGTLAAFASTSGQRIDEVPPTVSASSDGVVQVAVAASDYMNFPMTTYTCAYDEVVAAVRAMFAEWGGTGSGTGTIGYRGYDGTTETTFQAASASYDADSLTAVSSTYPRWMCAMWPSTNGWTQTELNAAALRVGFSTDATPDMGISAAYLEVAVKKVPPVRQLTVGEDDFTVDIVVHPYTSASVSYVIENNHATDSCVFNYSISGTPQTPVTVTAGNSQTVQVNANVYGDISDVTLGPA